MRHVSTIALTIGAFTAGIFAAHYAPRAEAAPVPIVAQAVDVAAITAADLPAPASGSIRSKLFVDAEDVTLGVYIGPSLRHYHSNSNEFQYIISGTGSEWFGDKTIALKPGMLLIIPKGMIHGGVTGDVKLIGIKTPPQAPDDNHPVPTTGART